MKWGQAPSEMVREFLIDVRKGDEWEILCKVDENVSRRWIKKLSEPILANALRVTVIRTWGIKEARICFLGVS